MTRPRAALPLLLPLLFGFVPGFGAPPGPERKVALERLRSATGERVEVRWAEGHGRIRTLAGRLAPPRPGRPEDVARMFLTSHDPTAGDDDYTRVLALVKGGPGIPAGIEAHAVLLNCIAQAKGMFPADDLPESPLDFRSEAVDRTGNLTAWPELQTVEVEPGSLTCSGDACGCCLLLSTDPAADPSAGGCAGLPGLAGVAGSGLEGGLCVVLWP